MSIRRKFSGALFAYRAKAKLSQQKMSERCGLSLRHYQDLEVGRALPTLEHAVAIAKELDLSLDALKDEVGVED